MVQHDARWPGSNESRIDHRIGGQSDGRWLEYDERRVDRVIAGFAARQHGRVARWQLLPAGVSARAIERRLGAGSLHLLHRGVYAVGHASVPLERRFLAAVKACGEGAVLSHFSAAALLELVAWDGRFPEVTVPAPGTRAQRGLRVHRTVCLDARDVTVHRGIPVTGPARTLLDVASVLDHRRLRRAVGQALALRRVTVGQLAEVLGRLRPRRGAANLGRILATHAAPTRSELEDVVLELIVGGGLERPDVNVPLTVAGRPVVPDFRWPAHRLIVEADGAAWHDHRIAREDDAERQALLEAHGERVLRVMWRQAVAGRAETLARLRAAGVPTAKYPSRRT